MELNLRERPPVAAPHGRPQSVAVTELRTRRLVWLPGGSAKADSADGRRGFRTPRGRWSKDGGGGVLEDNGRVWRLRTLSATPPHPARDLPHRHMLDPHSRCDVRTLGGNAIGNLGTVRDAVAKTGPHAIASVRGGRNQVGMTLMTGAVRAGTRMGSRQHRQARPDWMEGFAIRRELPGGGHDLICFGRDETRAVWAARRDFEFWRRGLWRPAERADWWSAWSTAPNRPPRRQTDGEDQNQGGANIGDDTQPSPSGMITTQVGPEFAPTAGAKLGDHTQLSLARVENARTAGG
jgi:hypothetical protein